jgi:hypothetical protein
VPKKKISRKKNKCARHAYKWCIMEASSFARKNMD